MRRKMDNNYKICKECVHYHIDYYMPGMPASCRSLKRPINSLNINH